MKMRTLLQLTAAATLVAAASSLASAEELIPADGSCWKLFAPRSQNAPTGEVRASDRGYILTAASGGKPHVYGGWRCRIDGIEPGAHYRLRARFVPRGFGAAASLREAVGVHVRWRGDFGGAVAPTYVWNARAWAFGRAG